MTTELLVLAYAALLQCALFVLMAIPANIELGPSKTLSPRDPQRLGKPIVDLVSPKTGRLIRAMNNQFEALILFTIAVLVVHLGDKGSGLTANLAWIFLGARVLYIPAYYFGLSPWRSLIWAIGWFATLGLLLVAVI